MKEGEKKMANDYTRSLKQSIITEKRGSWKGRKSEIVEKKIKGSLVTAYFPYSFLSLKMKFRTGKKVKNVGKK